MSNFLDEGRASLIDLLGKDLYSIFESRSVKADLPFGIKSKFKFDNKNLNLQKKFKNDYKFSIDLAKDNYKFKLTKDF